MIGRPRTLALAAALLTGVTCVRPVEAESLSCSQAAAAAEAGMAIPAGLLLAIGNVESGRTDPSGGRAPWPWTINTGGAGHFFASSEDAVFAVQLLRAAGTQSIDIGCFQINLFHHPDAFADLASGFDPLINARAAARFLASLHDELGTWDLAIAAYHSRASALGVPYRDHVLASWHGTASAGGPAVAGIHVWGPAGEIGSSAVGLSGALVSRTLVSGPPFSGAPFSGGLVSGALVSGALVSGATRIAVAASSRVRLPRVITISVH